MNSLLRRMFCSVQILLAFHPFSMKSFSITAFCFSVKTILTLSQTFRVDFEKKMIFFCEDQPVLTSVLHCNSFWHCLIFFFVIERTQRSCKTCKSSARERKISNHFYVSFLRVFKLTLRALLHAKKNLF